MKKQILTVEQIIQKETYLLERAQKEFSSLEYKFNLLGCSFKYEIFWDTQDGICDERPEGDYKISFIIYIYQGDVFEEEKSLECFTEIGKIKKKNNKFIFISDKEYDFKKNLSNITKYLTEYYNEIFDMGFEKTYQKAAKEGEDDIKKINKIITIFKVIKYLIIVVVIVAIIEVVRAFIVIFS